MSVIVLNLKALNIFSFFPILSSVKKMPFKQFLLAKKGIMIVSINNGDNKVNATTSPNILSVFLTNIKYHYCLAISIVLKMIHYYIISIFH